MAHQAIACQAPLSMEYSFPQIKAQIELRTCKDVDRLAP